MEHKKVVVVGDGFVGKTSLLDTFVNGEFPTDHIPTVFDTMNKTVVDGATSTVLNLWDTAGQEDFKRLRVLSYVGAQCFIMCYAIDQPISLDNIQKIWLPEIREKNTTAPIVLVGTKCDKRSDKGPLIIPTAAGRKMKNRIGASAYIECSAMKNISIQEVFVGVARTINGHGMVSCCVVC